MSNVVSFIDTFMISLQTTKVTFSPNSLEHLASFFLTFVLCFTWWLFIDLSYSPNCTFQKQQDFVVLSCSYSTQGCVWYLKLLLSEYLFPDLYVILDFNLHLLASDWFGFSFPLQNRNNLHIDSSSPFEWVSHLHVILCRKHKNAIASFC